MPPQFHVATLALVSGKHLHAQAGSRAASPPGAPTFAPVLLSGPLPTLSLEAVAYCVPLHCEFLLPCEPCLMPFGYFASFLAG